MITSTDMKKSVDKAILDINKLKPISDLFKAMEDLISSLPYLYHYNKYEESVIRENTDIVKLRPSIFAIGEDEYSMLINTYSFILDGKEYRVSIDSEFEEGFIDMINTSGTMHIHLYKDSTNKTLRRGKTKDMAILYNDYPILVTENKIEGGDTLLIKNRTNIEEFDQILVLFPYLTNEVSKINKQLENLIVYTDKEKITINLDIKTDRMLDKESFNKILDDYRKGV